MVVVVFLVLGNVLVIVIMDFYGDRDGFGVGIVLDVFFMGFYLDLFKDDLVDIGNFMDIYVLGD